MVNWASLEPVLLVLLGVILSGLGWVFRRAVSRGDDRNRQDSSQDMRLALLQQDVTNIKQMVSTHSVQLSNLNAEMSTVSALFGKHEEWHARHDLH